MSHIAPIELRLHLGLAAPVTAEEVGELLGIGDDERDRLLERVPPLAPGPRGGLRYLWARVLEALETKAPEAPKPANRLPLAEVAPRRGPRSRSS